MKTAIIGMLLSPLLLMAQENSGAWTNIGPSPAAVWAFAVDQQGMGTVFMGTITGGVQKSVDRAVVHVAQRHLLGWAGFRRVETESRPFDACPRRKAIIVLRRSKGVLN